MSVRLFLVWFTTIAAATGTMAAGDEAGRHTLGSDYPEYVAARTAHLRGAFEQAIPLYRRLELPLLRQAGDCYLAECLAAQGLEDEAMEFYERWASRPAPALDADWYRGQMLLGWALLRGKRGDWAGASGTVDQALAWLDRTRPKGVEEWSAIADPGHACPDFVRPTTLVNGATCPWYEPSLRARALLLQGFARAQHGQITGATDSFITAGRVNKQHGLSLLADPDAPLRLEWAARQGAFILPKTVWARLTPEYGPSLRMGFFLCLSGEVAQAQAIFDSVVAKGTKDSIPALDWAAAQLGQGVCRMRFGDYSGAATALARFDTLFRGNELGPLGRILLANAWSADSRKYKDALRIWSEVERDVAGTEQAARAMLSMAVLAANHDDVSVVSDAVERLANGHANRRERFVAERLLSELRPSVGESPAKAPAPQPRSGSPDAVTFKTILAPVQLPPRTITAPGLEDLVGVDLVRYESAAVPLVEGVSAMGLRLRVTESEPCLPLLGKGPRVWYRAPVLINLMPPTSQP